MKAIQLDAYGGPEVLSLRDVIDPVAGPGKIVVDIHAASVNPVDWKISSGVRHDQLPLSFPYTPGIDFFGVVRTVGEGVTDFTPSDAVFGVTPQSQQACYAEAIALDASLVAKKPADLSHADAAAMALVGATAIVSLDTVELTADDTVLIHAGAGGVGGFAIQYARHIGATIYATASARNHDYVRELGADEVIDYANEDFAKTAPPCDVVFDTIGGDVHKRSFAVLKPGGRLAYVAAPPEGFKPPKNVTVKRPAVTRDRAHLEKIVALFEAGAIQPLEVVHMSLVDAAKAQTLSIDGHVRGKIVFDIR
ncbi:MAG: NADP-dependent oxidoreductase [Rhodospirillaceae bacterium]|jgi:NADPH:quinone reductase-like Zn-dependent oxidoreductase|nr:NADP-dependent oxidoreductase [Rhodospirillaceae bacterium]MBT5458137.1 NADP-dependent oxidoreductase [Rhodospirillaceae bacterium]